MNKTDEYQTPKPFVKAAELTMGSIDLDPASSEANNKRLRIPHIFTKENSGLDNNWFGNVWLNPPYSKPNLNKFTNKILVEFVEYARVDQLTYLIPSFTSEKWYQNCLKTASAICLPKKRIEFLLNGVYQTSPRMSNTFFYFGDKFNEFCRNFQEFGFVRPI